MIMRQIGSLKFTPLIILMGCFFSCEKEVLEDTVESTVIYAYIEKESSKVQVENGVDLFWNANDRISVFQSSTNERYINIAEDGSDLGIFRKDDELPSGQKYPAYYAISPYRENTTCDKNGVIEYSFPSIQTFSEGSFDSSSNTMVAKSSGLNLENFMFKNVSGYLLIKLYGNDVVKCIKLYGNDGEKIAGPSMIDMSDDTNPTVDMSGSSETEITIDCGDEGVSLCSSPTDFWITLPPTEFKKGFTIEITDVFGLKATKSTDKPTVISSNRVKPMKAFEFDLRSSKDMLSFSLSDGIRNYDAFYISDNSIFVGVPNNTNVSSMTTTFTHSGQKVFFQGIEEQSGKLHDYSDFLNPLSFFVSDLNNQKKEYKVYICDIPALIVNTQDKRGIADRTYWVPGSSLLYDNETNIISNLGGTSMKGRGNSTWGYPKKPYAFKLDKAKSILGMPSDKRWNLLANWLDRTEVRNDVSFELARLCPSLEWVPRGKFVELILNGQYAGNYYLCEKIKISGSRVNITSMGKYSSDLTGGYILEFSSDMNEMYNFRASISNLPIMLSEQDWAGFDMTYIMDFINTLESKLSSPNISTTGYSDFLDVDSYVDWWLFYEMTMDIEATVPRGSYMYKDSDISPVKDSKIHAGPVWDFDARTYTTSRVSSWQSKNVLWNKYLFKDPYFVSRVKTKWASEKAAFIAFANSYPEQIASVVGRSVERDRKKWPLTSNLNGDKDKTYPEAIDQIKTTLLKKIDWMDSQINTMVVNQ